MNELHEEAKPVASAEGKKAWHAPVLEETSYTETEIGGAPGVTFDGYANYSVA